MIRLILVALLAILLVGCTQRQCLKGHMEDRHSNGYTSFIPIVVGKITVMSPQYHPARDYKEFVCEEYYQEEKAK